MLSINLWNFNLWPNRLSLIIDEINRGDTNVVLLQEVRTRRFCKPPYINTKKLNSAIPSWEYPPCQSQIEELANKLPGWSYEWQPAMTFNDGEPGNLHSEGLAVFTKLDVVSTSMLRLSKNPNDDGDFHQRLCLHLRIKLIDNIDFFVTHLSLSSDARIRTLGEIKKFISQVGSNNNLHYLQSSTSNSFCNDYPLLCSKVADGKFGGSMLAGDFNMEFNQDCPMKITDMNPLYDVWSSIDASKLFKGWRTPPSNDLKGWTFNSWDMKSRIDYIFSSENLLKKITEIRIVGDQFVPASSVGINDYASAGGVSSIHGKVFPSDHLFLYVSVEP